jgi:hypothetical protein
MTEFLADGAPTLLEGTGVGRLPGFFGGAAGKRSRRIRGLAARRVIYSEFDSAEREQGLRLNR